MIRLLDEYVVVVIDLMCCLVIKVGELVRFLSGWLSGWKVGVIVVM